MRRIYSSALDTEISRYLANFSMTLATARTTSRSASPFFSQHQLRFSRVCHEKDSSAHHLSFLLPSRTVAQIPSPISSTSFVDTCCTSATKIIAQSFFATAVTSISKDLNKRLSGTTSPSTPFATAKRSPCGLKMSDNLVSQSSLTERLHPHRHHTPHTAAPP